MAPTKRKATYDRSDSFIADDDDDSINGEATINPPKKQRTKPTKPTTPTVTTASHSVSEIPEMETDEEGNRFWKISTARRVVISDYKGKKLVTVREYYLSNDKWMPGKKGISMTLDQYSAFVSVMPQIEETLEKYGEKVERPRYGGGPVKGDDDAQNGNVDDAEERERKANIDATSDEEE